MSREKNLCTFKHLKWTMSISLKISGVQCMCERGFRFSRMSKKWLLEKNLKHFLNLSSKVFFILWLIHEGLKPLYGTLNLPTQLDHLFFVEIFILFIFFFCRDGTYLQWSHLSVFSKTFSYWSQNMIICGNFLFYVQYDLFCHVSNMLTGIFPAALFLLYMKTLHNWRPLLMWATTFNLLLLTRTCRQLLWPSDHILLFRMEKLLSKLQQRMKHECEVGETWELLYHQGEVRRGTTPEHSQYVPVLVVMHGWREQVTACRNIPLCQGCRVCYLKPHRIDK